MFTLFVLFDLDDIVTCSIFLIHKFITRYSIAVRGKVPSTLQYMAESTHRNLMRNVKQSPRSLATDPDTREVRKEGKKKKKTGMKEQYSVTP